MVENICVLILSICYLFQNSGEPLLEEATLWPGHDCQASGRGEIDHCEGDDPASSVSKKGIGQTGQPPSSDEWGHQEP